MGWCILMIWLAVLLGCLGGVGCFFACCFVLVLKGRDSLEEGPKQSLLLCKRALRIEYCTASSMAVELGMRLPD